jgi:hypothetical protein
MLKICERSSRQPGTNTPALQRRPVQDLDRARGVVFEEYDMSGIKTVDGIAEVAGNCPSKGGIGEFAAWFREAKAI